MDPWTTKTFLSKPSEFPGKCGVFLPAQVPISMKGTMALTEVEPPHSPDIGQAEVKTEEELTGNIYCLFTGTRSQNDRVRGALWTNWPNLSLYRWGNSDPEDRRGLPKVGVWGRARSLASHPVLTCDDRTHRNELRTGRCYTNTKGWLLLTFSFFELNFRQSKRERFFLLHRCQTLFPRSVFHCRCQKEKFKEESSKVETWTRNWPLVVNRLGSCVLGLNWDSGNYCFFDSSKVPTAISQMHFLACCPMLDVARGQVAG